jgi:Rrf2 family iron-sulfur cluster assembly transcriptional regulator
MLDLALDESADPVQCRDIALRQEIPEPYLNQILSLLRRAGLIVSRRGPGGGHQLARPAPTIGLGEIVEALDGPFVGVDGEAPSGSCAQALQDVWRDVGASAREAVDRITLAELADRARGRALSYQI